MEGLLTLDVAPRVYLGGLPDMSEVIERSGAGPEAEANPDDPPRDLGARGQPMLANQAAHLTVQIHHVY